MSKFSFVDSVISEFDYRQLLERSERKKAFIASCISHFREVFPENGDLEIALNEIASWNSMPLDFFITDYEFSHPLDAIKDSD